jgi:hypothetical protein
MAVSDKFAKHYHLLTGPERFRLVIEAAARRDRVEEDRLDAACPRGVYEVDDPGYRMRMTACATIALTVWGQVAQDAAGARVAHAMGEAASVYLDWSEALAEAGFFAGWHAARAVDGEGDDARPDPPVGGDDGDGEPDFGEIPEQDLVDLRREARRPIEKLTKIAVERVGRAYATAALSVWEGFGRFCREALELEPETVMAALTQGAAEAVAEVRATYPDAPLDDKMASDWADTLHGVWGRRFNDGA